MDRQSGRYREIQPADTSGLSGHCSERATLVSQIVQDSMDFWLPANNLGITSLNDGVIGALGQVDVAVGQCDSRMNVTNSRCISFFSAMDHACRSLRLGATEPRLRTWPCSSNGSRPTGCQARPSKARLYVSRLDRVSTSAPCIQPRSLKQQAVAIIIIYNPVLSS